MGAVKHYAMLASECCGYGGELFADNGREYLPGIEPMFKTLCKLTDIASRLESRKQYRELYDWVDNQPNGCVDVMFALLREHSPDHVREFQCGVDVDTVDGRRRTIGVVVRDSRFRFLLDYGNWQTPRPGEPICVAALRCIAEDYRRMWPGNPEYWVIEN